MRPLPAGVGAAFAAALLFGASTPLARILVGSVPPVLLAGMLYLGSGLGLQATVPTPSLHHRLGRRVKEHHLHRASIQRLHHPRGQRMFIYDAAMRYQAEDRPLVVFAGKDYGMGSSRDWAAKGARLLGIRAVIAESFERIHRSNLIGMGVLPLQFVEGNWADLGLSGAETVSIAGVASLRPRQKVTLRILRQDGRTDETDVLCRIDTDNEVEYFRNGGILHYVLRTLAKPS